MKFVGLKIAGIGLRVKLKHPFSLRDEKEIKRLYKEFICAPRSFNTAIFDRPYNRYAFNSFLRLEYSRILFEKKGFLLHASGVKRGDEALIFTGISGAGKTTIARLLKKKGYPVLSDEIMALKKCFGTWKAFGTPFMGEMKGTGKNISASKVKLHFIRKAKENASLPLSFGAAYEKLLRTVIMFKPEKRAAELALDFLKAAKPRILKFKKNDLKGVL